MAKITIVSNNVGDIIGAYTTAELVKEAQDRTLTVQSLYTQEIELDELPPEPTQAQLHQYRMDLIMWEREND